MLMKAKLKRAFDLFAQGFMSGFVGSDGGSGTMCGLTVQLYNNKRGDV